MCPLQIWSCRSGLTNNDLQIQVLRACDSVDQRGLGSYPASASALLTAPSLVSAHINGSVLPRRGFGIREAREASDRLQMTRMQETDAVFGLSLHGS